MSRPLTLAFALLATGCAYEAPAGTYAISDVTYSDNGCAFEDGGIFQDAKYELTQTDDVVELVYVGDPEVVFDGMDVPYSCPADGKAFTCDAAVWTLESEGATISIGHTMAWEYLEDVDVWRAGVFVDMTCVGENCGTEDCQSAGLMMATLE